jgi:DNA (cytosine-5)-methyltransferase 1
MRHGSLFSGIGGFDLAAEWMGWENVFHCEWNEFGQKILKHYWPNAKSYSDIAKTDFSIHRGQIDILTGGFPCQPYSAAGKRKGKEDERHLWPQMLRAVREIQPCWIIGENVFGLVNWSRGMVLRDIKSDLESEGFEMFSPLIIPACAKGAAHRRDRVWIIAHSSKRRLERRHDSSAEKHRQAKDSSIPALVENRNWTEYARSSVSRGVYGVPDRVDRIKALGNAIVPQVAYEIFRAIESII